MWIIRTWQCISPAVTAQRFKKCCTCSALDETDDDMLWYGKEQTGNIMSECEEGEDTDCEDVDSDTDW